MHPRLHRHVLLANELGRGFGHIGKLLAVARGLADVGMLPVLALPDPSAAADFDGRGIVIRQAPALSRQPPGPMESLADVLAAAGFADPDATFTLVASWRAIIDALEPALIVIDHAPFAALAAHAAVPCLALGTGFTLPPAHLSDFPSFTSGAPSSHPVVQSTIDQVLGRMGRAAPRAPALLAGDRHFVCTVPELDAFAGLRRSPAAGPLGDPPAELLGVSSAHASVSKRRFFAYLAGSASNIDTVLGGLVASGRPGTLYLRGGTREQFARLACGAIEVCPRPLPLARILVEHSLVIHHGGLNLAQQILLGGRSQLVLPDCLEQILNAESLLGLGGAQAFGTEEASAARIADAIASMDDAVVKGRGWCAAALAAAHDLRRRHPRGIQPAVITAALALAANAG